MAAISQRTSPKLEDLSATTTMLNVTLSFENALKLSPAVEECLRQLNSYNRSDRARKRSALNLAIHLSQSRITVNEASIWARCAASVSAPAARPGRIGDSQASRRIHLNGHSTT